MSRERPGDPIQRWSQIAASAAVVFIVGWLTMEAAGPPHRTKSDADAAASPSSAASSVASAVAIVPDAGASESDAGLAQGLGALGALGSLGTPPLQIPTGAPKQVKLGVVLVTFAGAEGAPPTARSKREAMSIAERLVGEARSDFHHAVVAGDPGSSDDIGRMPRGVLDPRTEVAVFNLASGEVSEILETPRGYWIVKRLD